MTFTESQIRIDLEIIKRLSILEQKCYQLEQLVKQSQPQNGVFDMDESKPLNGVFDIDAIVDEYQKSKVRV